MFSTVGGIVAVFVCTHAKFYWLREMHVHLKSKIYTYTFCTSLMDLFVTLQINRYYAAYLKRK